MAMYMGNAKWVSTGPFTGTSSGGLRLSRGRLAPGLVALILVLGSATPLLGQGQGQGRTFAVGALGGTVGALTGFGLGHLLTDPDACDEDLECVLGSLGSTLALAAAGGASGTFLAGKLIGDAPSVLGVVAGALVGSAIGLGVAKVMEDAGQETAVQIFSLSIAQGTFSALGNLLLGARRAPKGGSEPHP